MSQRAVESVLGRLITDVDFRARFLARPAEACRENGDVLTARETEALLRIDLGALHAIAVTLDPKIVRAAAPGSLRRDGSGGAQRFGLLRPTPATGSGGE